MRRVVPLLLVVLLLFSFATAVSANPTPRTDNLYFSPVTQAGNHTLHLDVWSYYNSSMSVKVYKEGPVGQWTEVYWFGQNLNASTYTSYDLNLGYLTPGNYKAVVDFSNWAYVENYSFWRP
ncbi:hypothetical protein NQ117_12195 [Paenibacillus sp. SC116]|uniref:hypothetical protein n=1 Tax=Paenibacillus sp. SC116 TaxID=2968986 RepID=UPI00215A65DD|nr:hypothetical protein [Paenibacillus sp. SC116]MCR8844446.1 hypothetical protein [Paenibacillus sp. SC116]